MNIKPTFEEVAEIGKAYKTIPLSAELKIGPFSKPFTAAFQLLRLSVSSYPAFISASTVWV